MTWSSWMAMVRPPTTLDRYGFFSRMSSQGEVK